MRIGDDQDYLLIEKVDSGDPHSGFRIEGKAKASRAEFSGMNDCVHFDITDDLSRGLDEFEALRQKDLDVMMTEGCNLRLSRDAHGNILVHYRIAHWKLGREVGLDGVAQVDGESGQRFCRDFRKLVLDS